MIDVPLDKIGQGSGSQSTVRQIGSALGIAVIGTTLFSATQVSLENRVTDLKVTGDSATGMVNAVVDHADLERVALEWAAKVNGKSPTAQRMLKFSFNLIDDGLVGQQVFAGEATRLAYMTDEAAEGRDSFLEKRDPDWSAFPWHY